MVHEAQLLNHKIENEETSFYDHKRLLALYTALEVSSDIMQHNKNAVKPPKVYPLSLSSVHNPFIPFLPKFCEKPHGPSP
jgi:hypothetical protein